MKKLAFLPVLVFLAVSIFAQNTINYDKILKGDLSDFVGYWINGNNHRVYLRANGTTYFEGLRASGFQKRDGIYSWGVGGDEGGFAIMLLPVGVETPYYNVTSDTTRVRLAMGHDAPGAPEEFYYRESEFPATHMTSENLRIRTDQNLSAATIKILEKGTKVLVQEWGNEVTIDGYSARWAYVFTSDGFAGWCYSGYLTEF